MLLRLFLAGLWLGASSAPAHAGFLAGALAALAGIVGSSAIAAAALNVIVGLGLQVLATRFASRPSMQQEDMRLRAGKISAVIPKRHVFGRYRPPGAMMAYKIKEDIAYLGYILNSRPSSGNFRLFLDKRRVETSGDPFNFSGGGAVGTNGLFADPHVRFWIGRGEQMGPPAQLLAEGADWLQPTDAWHGCTVIWLRLFAGGVKRRPRRWPSWPPLVEVEGDWSLVPSVSGGPASWSRNRSRIVLDVLTNNPIARYDERYLMLDAFASSAAIDDQDVPLLAGGSEKRWSADGLVVWDQVEIEEVAEEIMNSGAGRMVRVGGLLALTGAGWEEPGVTLRDVIGDSFEFSDMVSGDELPRAVTGTYVNPDRGWETSDIEAFEVPGADNTSRDVLTMNLSFVTSPTQGQRRLKHEGMRRADQRRLAATFPPEGFNAVAGGTALADLPAPFDRANGRYVVEMAAPVVIPDGQGVAMRVPMTLAGVGPEQYAWTPASDEKPIRVADPFDGFRPDMPLPGALASVAPGGTTPRIRIEFTPSSSKRATGHEWQYRLSGGSWQEGGMLDEEVRTSAGKAFFVVADVQPGQGYDFRVRAVEGDTEASGWVALTGVLALPPGLTIAEPSEVVATPGAGQIALSSKTPNEAGVAGLEFWVGTTNVRADSTLLIRLYGAANATYAYTHTGLGAGVTRYYWAKTVGPYGAVSGFSAGDGAITS